MAEIPVLAGLMMDRSDPLGNSQDRFLRRALHVKVGNKDTEAIPVFVVSSSIPTDSVQNLFNQVPSVPSGTETTLITYTVPPTKAFSLYRVQFSGQTIGAFQVYVDSVLIAVYRTQFGTPWTEQLLFDGLLLNAGQILSVTVTQNRNAAYDFDARITGLAKDV